MDTPRPDNFISAFQCAKAAVETRSDRQIDLSKCLLLLFMTEPFPPGTSYEWLLLFSLF